MTNSRERIVIAGGGPAGLTASLFLSAAEVPHIVLEKHIYPRDKICGDAVSGKALELIARHRPDAVRSFAESQQALLTYGMQFSAPNGKSVDIAFPRPKGDLPVGFLSKRIAYDNFLFEQTQSPFAEIRQGASLEDAYYTEGGVRLEVKERNAIYHINSPLVIGADGDRSVVRRKLQDSPREDGHYCAGIRAYYQGVTGLHPENYLELHFLRELLPGYFWIFPLANGAANVGMGMLSKDVKRRKVNLKKAMSDVLESHPTFKDRFVNATLEGPIRGWGLPFGSKKQKLSGNGYLLTGDAASLIDPFTGEGIGNATVSGMVAARVAIEAWKTGAFTAASLAHYDRTIYSKLWDELLLSYRMQRLTRVPWLFDFVVSRIHGNARLRDIFTNMFVDLELRAKMKNPLFYLQLLRG